MSKPARKIVIFASPKCVEDPRLHKAYFNVAWFVRAYESVLTEFDILTTEETKVAVEQALNRPTSEHNNNGYWDVPAHPSILSSATTANRFGFDGQVWLMGAIVRGEVERVLMFMDPLDTKAYLPETYAFIRNCTLADVGLHINLGATYWAESEYCSGNRETTAPPSEARFGKWRTIGPGEKSDLNSRLNPDKQMVHFIAHDNEKERLSRFVYDYREVLASRHRMGWEFSGTFGTCVHIEKYLLDHMAPAWERPSFKPAGTGTTGHGPTGGDVVIADEICSEWPVPEEREDGEPTPVIEVETPRQKSVSHTVMFFIDYYNARPHETDIHVLLRTCLNPHRGVHLILNIRSAIEWGETIRSGCFATVAKGVDGGHGDQRNESQ